jgi:multiple sugar transport system substrate-binding protein
MRSRAGGERLAPRKDALAVVRSRRITRAIGALVVLGAALAVSCAKDKGAEEIVFWQFWPADVITPLIQKFERENPGAHVRMEQLTWDSGKDKILAAVASGNVPDLCELGSTYMPRFLASGSLSDWSAGVADLKSGLRGWEMCSIGDAIYGLPWVLGTRALFYDKTLFARAGLDSTRPPETWGELEHAAAAIQKLGGDVHGYGVSAMDRQKLFKKFMPYAWGNGGEILCAGGDSACFDSPANREALEFYLRLRKVGTMGMQDVLDREFKEGRLGLEVSGAWLSKQIPKESPGLRYGVALIPMPGPSKGTHASFAGGEVLVSFQRSRHKEEALKLARVLARPENELALAEAAMSVQPATVGADTAAFYREHPDLQTMIRQFATARFTPNHPEWDAMEAAIEDEVEEALYDRKTPARAVADANARIAELVRKH